AGIGRDVVVGGAGDNTYIAQASSSADDGTTFLGGLGDKNIAIYGREFDGASLIMRPDPLLQTPESRGILLTGANVHIGARKDILLGIQELDLHGNNQTLSVVGAGSQATLGGTARLVVDGTSADPGKGNTLDLRGFGGDTSVKNGMSDLGAALEAFKDRKFGETTKLQFKGFNTLWLTDGNNKAILRPSTGLGLRNLFMGEGNDTVDSAIENLRIDLGDGDDILLRAGAGSIVAAGEGNDIFQLNNQVLLTGLSHNDKILIGSHVLTGGIRHQGSESPWAIGADGTRYGFDDLGNLIIKDLFGNVMGIANPVTGPGTFNTDTAGLYVAEVSLSFVRLRDLGAPDPNWQLHQFEYVNALSKAYSQTAIYRGVDPIVLDLTGAGLRFTDVNMAAPRFDINGNGFAVRTGWVKTGTGILVLDRNVNGKIDNVGEMFGGPELNGFTALAAYDTVPDGVIDALDEIFSQLRVWVDGDGDAITDPGELKSFGDLGIASIGLATLPMVGTFIAGNQVLETGHFTWSDGSLGTVADVAFHVDNYDTRFLGDTSVGAAAEGLPNQKGYGTLTDLSVAITHDPALTDPPSGTSLRDVLLQTLPTLDTIDLATLRERVTPILTAWAAASRAINPDGTLSAVTPSGHADLPILVRTTEGGESVDDFAYQVTDAEGSYYRLASGAAVRDAEGEVIARPTLEQVMAQPIPAQPLAEREWTTLSGAEIDFMERYLGDKLPFDTVPDNPLQALAALRPIVTQMHRTLDELTVNIAMAGPLAPYFVGIGYDVATNTFEATTSYQLEPMFEAIFRDAPADAAGATQWLEQWKPILDVVLGDFARGEGQDVTYGYRLANVVAAYEAASLPLDLRSAAITLGIPGDLIIAGGAELTSGGSNDANLFYLSNGDQTVTGGGGPDNYI
ncbi:MAG TPA: hypothetical protein VE487_15445, partial [Ilumatobacter sp.]|nr:hypothetical protein [Ilumatobacter sp.]